MPAARPVRSRVSKGLLVNNEKFLTGQAPGLSKGVKTPPISPMAAWGILYHFLKKWG